MDRASEEALYKQRVASLYSRVAPTYGTIGVPIFQHAANRLVDLADVGPGAQVLDVGAGRGAVLFRATERVGSTGRVVGTDLAEGMVRETTAEIARRGVGNAEMCWQDAEALALPDAAFDLVLCSFAIFHFPRLERALGEFLRVLRPEGRIGIAQSGSKADPRWRWQNELVNTYARLEPLPVAMQRRELRQPGNLARILDEAGFVDAREVVEEEEFTFRDEDDWWNSLWTHGERRALEAMTPDALARFKEEALARLRELKRGGPLAYRLQFIFTLARRPGTSPRDRAS